MDAARQVTEDLVAVHDDGVEYCLLRNWGFLDGEDLGDDVDVLIPSAERGSLAGTLDRLGYAKTGDRGFHTGYVRYLPACDELVRLDISWDAPRYNCLPIADGEAILANRRFHRGVPVAADTELFVELLFHGALNKNGFGNRPAYRRWLLDHRDSIDVERAIANAESAFGPLGGWAVRRAIEGDLAAVVDAKWRLVAASLLTNRELARPFLSLLLFEYQLRRPLKDLNRRYNPLIRQPTIAVLGPDGSGKTTTVENVASALEREGLTVETCRLGVYNDSSILMKAAKRLRNTVVGYDYEAQEHARESRTMELGSRNAVWKCGIHTADILLRQAAAQASGADVLVADRYLHDIVIHDRVGPFKRPLNITETGPVYPYVLDADTDVIAARSEYTADSVAEMRDRLSAVDAPRIDVSTTPAETTRALLTHLFTETDFLRAIEL